MANIISIKINGEVVNLTVSPNELLVDTLRERLELTGTKKGCETGECGACTVLVDSKPVNSCLLLTIRLDGKEVVTIEGLQKEGKLNEIQQAFVDTGAIQCGYCTPGMIMSAKALLDKNPVSLSVEEIRESIAGNLCRCTGYEKIVEAIILANKKLHMNQKETSQIESQ